MRRSFAWTALLCFAVVLVHPQTANKVNSSDNIFKAKVHVVVVDVVVTDRNDQPINGLQKEDFQILEESNPQTIASFEEHKGVTDQATMPPLPPHMYTNYPLGKPADSINVLLLDSLNTPLGDQSKVRLQMVGALKSIPAGSHMAIFTLSSGLRMMQGFTSDSSILLAALNKSRVQMSPLLGVEPVDNLDTQINKQIAATGAGMPAAAVASMETLQQFQNQTQNFQGRLRMTRTLESLQELANYLQGFPGRKNVIWFSGSFPLAIIPGKGVQNYEFGLSEQLELRKTVNMLAAAQVAIYPIAPEGLAQKFDSSGSRVKSVSKDAWRTVQDQDLAEVTSPTWETDRVSREQAQKTAHQATMYETAKDTGGEAFYNTNGLREALARAISDGAHYYTMSYSPTDKRTDGRYRRIDVKLLKGNYQMAYRHGYFAEEVDGAKKGAVQPERNPLQPLMIGGLPEATQIVYKIRVLPLLLQPGSKTTDTSSKNSRKEQRRRYGIDFAVLLHDLTFKVTAEGLHTAKLEIALVAYDQDGTPVNSIVRSADISLNPELYMTFEKTGVPLHEEIEVPDTNVYLRTGIYEIETGKAGTLEVPLNQVAASGAATKPKN